MLSNSSLGYTQAPQMLVMAKQLMSWLHNKQLNPWSRAKQQSLSFAPSKQNLGFTRSNSKIDIHKATQSLGYIHK